MLGASTGTVASGGLLSLPMLLLAPQSAVVKVVQQDGVTAYPGVPVQIGACLRSSVCC